MQSYSEWLAQQRNPSYTPDTTPSTPSTPAPVATVTTQPSEPEGFWGETVDYVQDRAGDLAGNFGRFAGRFVEGYGGLMGLDSLADAGQKLQDESTKLINYDFGYDAANNQYSWDKVKDNKDVATLAGYILREGLGSIPDMAAFINPVTLGAYGVAQVERLANDRAEMDMREEVDASDYAVAVPTALATILLDKIGLDESLKFVKGGGLKSAGQAMLKEGGTEFVQEGIESTATTLGTETGFDAARTFDQGLAGAVAGAGMGGSLSAARTGYERFRPEPTPNVSPASEKLRELDSPLADQIDQQRMEYDAKRDDLFATGDATLDLQEAMFSIQQQEDYKGDTIKGIHFSNTDGLRELDPYKFGTGMNSAEAARLQNDDGITSRSYFYAGNEQNDGSKLFAGDVLTGTRGQDKPEMGAPQKGTYESKLSGLYNMETDPLGLAKEFSGSELEKEVVARGFTGIYSPDALLNRGTAVVLDGKPVRVNQVGQGEFSARANRDQAKNIQPNSPFVYAENIPSKDKSQVGQWLVDQPVEVKTEFTDKAQEIFWDKFKGVDRIAEAIGIRGYKRSAGNGYYQGNVSPNNVIQFEDIKDAEAYARAYRVLTSQDAVPFSQLNEVDNDTGEFQGDAGEYDVTEGYVVDIGSSPNLGTVKRISEIFQETIGKGDEYAGFTEEGNGRFQIANFSNAPDFETKYDEFVEQLAAEGISFEERATAYVGKYNDAPEDAPYMDAEDYKAGKGNLDALSSNLEQLRTEKSDDTGKTITDASASDSASQGEGNVQPDTSSRVDGEKLRTLQREYNQFAVKFAKERDDTGRFENLAPEYKDGNILFSTNSVAKEAPAPEQAKSLDFVQAAVDKFKAEFGVNGGLDNLNVLVRETQQELLGDAATVEEYGVIEGVYVPTQNAVGVVASSMRSEKDIKRVLRHEIIGHYGLNTFKPEQKKAFLDSIIASSEAKGLAEVWQAIKADKVYGKQDKYVQAEEVFTSIIENEVSVPQQVWDTIITALRKAYRATFGKNLLLSKSELRNEARLLAKGIREGKAQQNFPADNQTSIGEAAPAMLSKQEGTAPSSLLKGWKQIALSPKAFTYPVDRKSKDLKTLLEVGLGVTLDDGMIQPLPKWHIDDLNDQVSEKSEKVKKGYTVDIPDIGEFEVMETKDNGVFVNVSTLFQGDGGSSVYSVVGNYAHNTGKKFIGDPHGLTDVGTHRRLENMIASALKFGTTKHLAPHTRQTTDKESEYQDKGKSPFVEPLNWIEGNHEHNLLEMIEKSYQAVAKQFPEITDLSYNSSQDTIVDSEGNNVDIGKWLESKVERSDTGEGSYRVGQSGVPRAKVTVGKRTLKRAIVSQSILRSDGEGINNRLLVQLGRFDAEPLQSGLERILYSKRDSKTSDEVKPNPRKPESYLGLTEEEKLDRAKAKIGQKPPPVVESVKAKFDDLIADTIKNPAWRDRIKEGLFDQLRPIKQAEAAVGITDVNKAGYTLARLATGVGDIMHGAMNFGVPELTSERIIQRKEGSEGLMQTFASLGEDLDTWLGWMAANRAERLNKEDRENNLTEGDIKRLKALAKGKEAEFEKVRVKYMEHMNATLDIAVGAGLLKKKSANKFKEDKYYIPFFRDTADPEVEAGWEEVMDSIAKGRVPIKRKGLTRQTSGIERLKGSALSTKPLLENIMSRYMTLIDASMKNLAANEVVENLTSSEIGLRDFIEPITQKQVGFLKEAERPRVIIVMQKGVKKRFFVKDPALFRALTGVVNKRETNLPIRVGRKFKKLLTTGVTSSPDFMARNYIRDSLQAWMVNKDFEEGKSVFKLGKDSIKGLKESWNRDENYRDMLFAGASFQGGYVHGGDPEGASDMIRRNLRRMGKSENFIEKYMGSVTSFSKLADVAGEKWEAYREAGDRLENANRDATYAAARKTGKTKREAAYEAKDLMDYSMMGNYKMLQGFVDVIPFLNARIQGLYKLARASKAEGGEAAVWKNMSKALAWKGGQVAMLSAALAMFNDDDERYKELPDWDKDMNWHFFLGDEHVRVPKPFELGLIFGTMSERLARATFGSGTWSEVAGAAYRGGRDTLSFNPIPQVFMPITEVYFNESFFKDAPIENMGDANRLPQDRYNAFTSDTMIALGQVTGLSPKKLEHLLNGYFGTMGGYTLSASDMIVRTVTGKPARPTSLTDLPVIKSFYRGDGPARSTQYGNDFYEMLNEVGEVYGSYKERVDRGASMDELDDYLDSGDRRALLKARPLLNNTRKGLKAIRERMDLINNNRSMSNDEKKEALEKLTANKNALTRRAVLYFNALSE